MTRRRSRAGTRPGPSLVTLTGDLGAEYTAQLKAVLLRSVAPERIVELSHELRPHDVAEAAFVLRAMASGFPPGTIHLAVVDPGVGGRRAALVVACADGSLLVGPDNGLLMPLAERLGRPRAFRLDPSRLGEHERVGTTFDARDLFAPAAALLARGVPPEALGRPVVPTRLDVPAPQRSARGARGQVVHVDHFGNVVTSIPSAWVPAGTTTVILGRRGGRTRRVPWVRSYEEGGRGRLVALGSSFGTVEVAVGEGSASDRLGLAIGRPVRLAWRRPRPNG